MSGEPLLPPLYHANTSYVSEDGVVHDRITCTAACANFLVFVGFAMMFVALASPEGPSGAGFDGNPIFFIGAFFVIFYYCECCIGSKAFAYLNNVMAEEDFAKYIPGLQGADPGLGWSIQNYHYEERIQVTTDANGNKHETKQRVRVDTHRASTHYPVKGHTDETMSPAQMLAMYHLLHLADCDDMEMGLEGVLQKGANEPIMLAVNFPLEFHPRDAQTELDVPEFRDDFYARNTTDKFQDKMSSKYLTGVKHIMRALVVLHPQGVDKMERPWWASRYCYLLASLFCMSVPYRRYLYSKMQKTTWPVTKHFSRVDGRTWTEDPLYTLCKSPDKKIAAVMNMKGGSEGDGASDTIRFVSPKFPNVRADATLPHYWTNQDASVLFDTKEQVPAEMAEQIQILLDSTFKDKATRDRREKLPTRMKLVSAHRIEDQVLWARYALHKAKLQALRGSCSLVREIEGSSGEAKTTKALADKHKEGLCDKINEMYLWHGTSPTGAFGIRETGFNINLAGSFAGTMFGPGAYFAECCSKSDEYARCDNSGLFGGVYALLLCRVACGEMFRTEVGGRAAAQPIQDALDSQKYDSVLGDREAKVDTFREFVVFDESQVYPEYVVLYKKEY